MSARAWAGVPLWATEHVVVPAAAVGLLVGVLHHAIDLREAFVAGGTRLRLLSICLVAAVVLVVRYGRVHRDRVRQGAFVLAVALSGALAILAQPERGGFVPRGIGAPVLFVAYGLAWALAARLAGTLSLRPPAPELGTAAKRAAERLEQWKELQKEPSIADPLANLAPLDSDRPETPWGGDPPSAAPAEPDGPELPAWAAPLWTAMTGAHRPDDASRPARDVAVVLAPAVGLFVVGGAVLSFADPAVAARGQLDMLLALGCGAVLLAAASALGTFRELRTRRGRVSLGVVPGRVLFGGALAAVVLLGALALPGMRWTGSFAIDQQALDSGAGRASSDPEAPKAEGKGQRGEGGERQAPPVAALGSLAGLARGALVLLVLLGVLGAAFVGAAGLRIRRPKRPAAHPRDARRPRPSMARLAGLPDDEVVPAAYALFLDAAEAAGSPKAPKTTPRQFLAQLGDGVPREPARELTVLLERQLYAEAPQPGDPDAARRALQRILR